MSDVRQVHVQARAHTPYRTVWHTHISTHLATGVRTSAILIPVPQKPDRPGQKRNQVHACAVHCAHLLDSLVISPGRLALSVRS